MADRRWSFFVRLGAVRWIRAKKKKKQRDGDCIYAQLQQRQRLDTPRSVYVGVRVGLTAAVGL